MTIMTVLALGLGACQTTQDAARNVRVAWVGQPVDAFFVENGPPVSSYARRDGGAIFTWRGGEASYVVPAQVQRSPGSAQPLASTSRTETRVSNPSLGTQVTRSTTTSFSFGVPQPSATQVIRPARRVELVCEAQIAVDDEGIIESVRISRDTQGEFLSFSRCADVFGSG